MSMQFDPPLTAARLERRYKRFLADVIVDGGERLTVHCANTGAMTGCAEPGSRCWLQRSPNPRRKYAYTLEQVQGRTGLIGVNTSRANALVREALVGGVIAELNSYASVRPEAPIPQSSQHAGGRFDFLLTDHASGGADCYVEVKSVTLATTAGEGLFPDAVSARARKHLRALVEMRAVGHRAVLLFCVQHDAIQHVAPAAEIDPSYAQALREAVSEGVELLAYRAQLSPTGTWLDVALPVNVGF